MCVEYVILYIKAKLNSKFMKAVAINSINLFSVSTAEQVHYNKKRRLLPGRLTKNTKNLLL